MSSDSPGGGPCGRAAMADGTVPAPGGWNRFVVEDPAGNPVELFQPTLPEARLGSP
jgi:hypothetical protein